MHDSEFVFEFVSELVLCMFFKENSCKSVGSSFWLSSTTYNVGDMYGLHSASNPHELVMLQVPSLDIIVSNIHILGEVTSHMTLPSAGVDFCSPHCWKSWEIQQLKS